MAIDRIETYFDRQKKLMRRQNNISKNIAITVLVIGEVIAFVGYISGTIAPKYNLVSIENLVLRYACKIVLDTLFYGGVGFFLGRWLFRALDGGRKYVYILLVCVSSCFFMLLSMGAFSDYWARLGFIENAGLYFYEFYPIVITTVTLFLAIFDFGGGRMGVGASILFYISEAMFYIALFTFTYIFLILFFTA